MKRIDASLVNAVVQRLSTEDRHAHRYFFQRNTELTTIIQDRAWELQTTLRGCYAAIRAGGK